jgi:cytochrome c2
MTMNMRWSGMVAALVLVAGAVVVPVAAQGSDKDKGAKVFAAQKCSICHNIGSSAKKMGPELTKVGASRNKAWLQKYLVDPKADNPKNKMPAVKVKGEDLEHLIAYLLSLK